MTVEVRWCYGCHETKPLTPENWAWVDKTHTRFRNKCRKCTNFDSKISHRIHYEERKERALRRKELISNVDIANKKEMVRYDSIWRKERRI